MLIVLMLCRPERMNGVARMILSHSDKHHPSQHVAKMFAKRESIRHLLDGGHYGVQFE